MWPEIGSVSLSDSWTSPLTEPLWQRTEHGLAALDVDTTWLLTTPTATPELTVTLATQPVTADGQTAAVVNDGGVGVVLSHVKSGDAIWAGVRTPTQTLLQSLPRLGAERAAVHVTMADGACTVVLRLSDGRTLTFTSNNVAFTAGWTATQVKMQGAGAMSGILCDHRPTPVWASLTFARSAHFEVSALQYLRAMPALRGDTALSLLTAQAQAECASVWLNSLGHLHWVGRGILELRAPVATKTTELSVDSFAWADNLQRVRERVTVSYRSPAISLNDRPNILLYQGEEQTFTAGQVAETWLEPGADADWVMPDTSLSRVAADTTGADLMLGSWGGGILVSTTAGTTQEWAGEYFDFSTFPVGGTLKLTQAADSPLPASRTVLTKTMDDATTLPQAWHGVALPMVRGKAKVLWAELTVAFSTGATGVIASYEHSCSWWVQDAARLTELNTFLAAALNAPQPELTNIDIDPDPRLELGDKITIADPARTGLELDLVITGISQAWGGGVPTMTLNGRITRIIQATAVQDPPSLWDNLLTDMGWSL